MNLKDLFIAQDGEQKEPTPKQANKPNQQEVSTMPIGQMPQMATIQQPVPQFNQTSNQYLDKFVETYQDSFNKLSKSTYDFFQFYQAIMASGGADQPQMYTMGMAMGSAMDKTNSKAKLLSDADYYANEIVKVFNNYVEAGNTKKQGLTAQKENENRSLTADLTNLKTQFETIKAKINDKENQLSLIDGKYQPLIAEVDGKLDANSRAKDMLVNSILKVKQGIDNYIK